MFRAAVTIIVVTTYMLNLVSASVDVRIKNKILKMVKELFLDGHAKVTSVMQMRHIYSSSPVYHLGRTTYKVRQKYARMIFLYMTSTEFYNEMPYNIHIGSLVEMQELGMYIDNLIRMVSVWAVDENEKEKQVKTEEDKKKQNAHIDRLRWQIKKDTVKIVRQGDKKDEETNKYMNGFNSDFNR